MSTQLFISQQTIAVNASGSGRDPLNMRRAANISFNKAMKRASRRALLGRLLGRSRSLHQVNSNEVKRLSGTSSGIKYVALDDITGSEGRSGDFDDQFWPLKEYNRDRWVNIAQAMASNKPLPPVQLIQTSTGFVVRDGHHRLSVARAMGREVIEAEIV